MEIRLLSDHRDDLVAERTRVQNRLRWHLVTLDPELEASLKRGALTASRQLDRIDRRLRRIGTDARVRVARDQISQLRSLTRQINALKDELLGLITRHRPQLLAEVGCGPLVAAVLIGRTAGAQRFATDASFALQSGTAPIKCSSGQSHQHRLNRGGDRQLNRALHVIALTRAQHHPETRQYLDRKRAEGKSPKAAHRCLKRHLARRFHHLLTLPSGPLKPDPAPLQGAAPLLMPCTRKRPTLDIGAS